MSAESPYRNVCCQEYETCFKPCVSLVSRLRTECKEWRRLGEGITGMEGMKPDELMGAIGDNVQAWRIEARAATDYAEELKNVVRAFRQIVAMKPDLPATPDMLAVIDELLNRESEIGHFNPDAGIPASGHPDLWAYHLAPSGEGPHAATWKDKPHRLVYDLTRMLAEEREAQRSHAVCNPQALDDLLNEYADSLEVNQAGFFARPDAERKAARAAIVRYVENSQVHPQRPARYCPKCNASGDFVGEVGAACWGKDCGGVIASGMKP